MPSDPIMKWFVAVILLPIALGLGAVLLNRPPLFDPPGVWQRLLLYLRTNVAETRLDQSRAELRPRRYARPVDELRRLTREAMADLGWGEPGELEGRLTAEVRTPLFGFTDDVEVWFEPDRIGDQAGVWVGVRSVSRVGRGDFAANTRHVLDLYAALERRL
jgi:uncharacterized protein (DUF1499 family)